ncbi:hypothetical protein [Campylobacter sp. RM16187]|uniref:hypothetical protein n=1 Tax=Campylobacter sp. RM16187 TaxID=1660063 RepID=UPI0021B674F6|nr:hypothetical protein [Campylobacter sp. RM16187]QKG30269.1 hypothetical protein CDOMF_a020 [Campylobacter sp. RM16187]
MKKVISGLMVLGLLISGVSADILSKKDCNDPKIISALKTYYKDFEKYEGRPAPTFEGVKFRIKSSTLGQGYVKEFGIKKEDGYICETGGSGIGKAYRVIKLNEKIYVYDSNYVFDNKTTRDTKEFVLKYGVILE